jgi:lipoate synthase
MPELRYVGIDAGSWGRRERDLCKQWLSLKMQGAILTLVQYLQPAPGFIEVSAYINPKI